MPFIGNQIQKQEPIEKTAYQQNVSQPVQTTQPMQSARQQTLGKIYQIAETDPARAKNLYSLYDQARYTPGTPVYNQYSMPTNQAVNELAKYGINANGMTTDWFSKNTSWQQYLQYNGTTNTPSKPGKKATDNEWKAYWTYQIFKSAEDTDNAEREWSALKQELTYKAKNPNRNDSDDEILNAIDWKKYPTLSKMQTTEGVNPVELNRGINFSKDDMYGVMWAARNGYEGDDNDYAIAMGAIGAGNVWQENTAMRDKLNWNNRDTYSPYSVGMTLDNEVGMYFDMTSFNADDIERLRQSIDPNDATSVKMFQKVQSAWENTQEAEKELDAIEKKVDTWISRGKDKQSILDLTEKYIENNCPTLKKMDDSIETGGSLVETTKAINYKKKDFLDEIGKYCDTAGIKPKEEEFAAEVEQESAPVTAQPTAEPVKTTPVLTAQAKAVIARKNKALADAGDLVDDIGTPAEKTASAFSWSALFDQTKQAIKTARDSFAGGMNKLVQNSIRSSISSTADAILNGSEVIASHEQNVSRLETVNKRCEEIEAALGDLIYSGMDIEGFNRPSVEVEVDGVRRVVTAERNNRTGEYEITKIRRADGQQIPTSKEIINETMQKAKEQFARMNDLRDRIASVSGVDLSDEEKAMLDEYKTLSDQRDGLVNMVRESDAAYNEAKDKQNRAQAKRTAVINMLQKAGVPSEELKVFEDTGAVIDVLNGFTQYDPTVWEAFNAYDLYAQQIAFDGADKYDEVFSAAEEGDAQNRQELETALWVLDYSERMGIDIPDNIKGNINRYIAKLERDHKDFEYFSLLKNEDFDEEVRRGRERVQAAEWDWGAYDGTIQSQPAWDMLSDEQKDQLISMMDVYDINDVAATFENMVANNAGDPVEDRLFGMFLAGNLMSDYEINTYYYLLAKEGQEAADAYYNHLADSSYGALTVRSKESIEFSAKELADQGFWGRRSADVYSMILAPAAAFGSFAYGVEYGIKKLTGQEVEYNPNNPWLSFNQFRTSARAEIQQEIINTYGEGSVAQQIFSSVQEIISNRGDSMMNMMAFGWLTNGMTSEMAQEFIGALPMAAGAAADVMASAKDKGASDLQAWMVGSVALICEAGTEAISISNITKAFKIGEEVSVDTVRAFLKNWVTKAGWSEAFGESFNDFFENVADEAFMGPLSEHARRVAELKEADPNMSDKEADAQARREEFSSILHTALISFLSPGMDIVPLAAGRANYYRAQTKFAQQHGANVSILDVMRSDKAIRERSNTNAANEASETTSAATEQAGQEAAVATNDVSETTSATSEQTEQAEQVVAEAPQEEAAESMTETVEQEEQAEQAEQEVQEEQAEETTAEETTTETQEEASEEEADLVMPEPIPEEEFDPQWKQLCAEYTLLDKAKNADPKSRTATFAAVLDVDGTDVSNDVAKAAAAKIFEFLDVNNLAHNSLYALGWVQNLMLDASDSNIDFNTLKQALCNAILGGENSAAYKTLIDDKFGESDPFAWYGKSIAEQENLAQKLAKTVEQDAADPAVQASINQSVRESRVADAEGRIIADGDPMVSGKLETAKNTQDNADFADREAQRATKNLEERHAMEKASGEAVQTANENLANDPSDENKKILLDALSKHKSNVLVTQEYEQALQKALEKQKAAQAEATQAREDAMMEIRQQAEAMVAQEDQQRMQAAEDQRIAEEQQRIAEEQAEQQAIAEAAAQQAQEDELSGKAEEIRQDTAIEQEVEKLGLEQEDKEEQVEAAKERRTQIKEALVPLKNPVSNAEGVLAIKAFGRKMGVDIQLYSDDNKAVRGRYSNGTIYLNTNRGNGNKMSIGQALVEASLHEITHSMENTGAYKGYRGIVLDTLFNTEGSAKADAMSLYDSNGDFRAKVDSIINQRKQAGDKNFVGQDLNTQVQNAEKELVADFARLNLANQKTVQRFMDAGLGGRMRNVLHNINQALKNYFRNLTGEERRIAEGLRRAERAFQKAMNEVARTAVHPESEQFSIAQFAQATNMTFNEDTQQLFDKNGNEIDGVKNKVTTEMIDQTPVGMLINQGLTGEQNTKAKDMMAGLMNMIARYRDSNLVWEIGATTLSSTFSALKSNSDPQYKTTVDFGTVCAKTQAIIDTMSKVMTDRAKEGNFEGLSRKDIMKVYDAVNKAGLSVPCPVCYVFSRWMGVPSLLGQMSKYQHEFVALNEDGKINKEKTQENVDAYLKKATDEYGDAKAINNQKSKLQGKLAKLDEQREDLVAQSRDKTLTKEQKKAVKEQLNDVLDQSAELEKKIGEVSAYNWITQALCKKDKNGNFVVDDKFKVTPDEILFDLNRTGDFAGYEKNWKYRNTRGAGMGKAIMPYSGETIGDVLYGVKAGGRQIKNPWLNTDEKNAAKQLKQAQDRAKKQNLVGGQRLQSTSDFRPEWGLDYIMSFLELQAAKSKVQMYTKVAEAVDFFASVGADVNLSIMGKGTGWHEATADEIAKMTPEQKEAATLDGKVYALDFSDITGMKYGTALDLKNKHDNVQMILVGMNDTHIRLAMKNSDIDFIIPWHSSGNSQDTLKTLVGKLGEKLITGTDYSSTQTDSVSPNRTEEQKNLWDARMKLLTKGGSALTEAEISTLMSNPITSELYKRFTQKGYDDDCYNVKLSKEQANQIFPYEYWDTNSTKDTADENGKRFADYCEAMGIVPRFSQFKDDPGYWKLLIDRPMYNNDGSYHQQQIIDVTNAKIGELNEEGQLTDSDIPTQAQAKYAPKDPRNPNYEQYTEAQKNAIEYAKAALEMPYDEGTEGQYSVYGDMTAADLDLIGDADTDYRSAIERGDMQSAHEDVEFAAQQAGYTEKVYHGTNSFGFTEFNGGDTGYTFVAYDSSMAGTYSASGDNIRNTSEGMRVGFRDMDNQQIVDYLNSMDEDLKKAFQAEGYSFINAELDEDGDIRINLEDGYGDTFSHDEFVSYALSEEPFITENSGVYQLYAKPGKQLVIDANGDSWNGIHWFPEGAYYEDTAIRLQGLSTGEIANIASNMGYDSVRINNVFDHGRWHTGTGVGDIGIFFDSNDLKSADTITYDDNGNVIPLSERFTSSDDIRYSVGGEETAADADRTLTNSGVITQKEIEAFNETTERPLEGRNPAFSTELGTKVRAFADENGMLQNSDELDEFAKSIVEAKNTYFPDTNEAQVERAINWVKSIKRTAESTGLYEALDVITSDEFNYLSADGQARMVVAMGLAVAKNDVMAQAALADAFDRQGTDIGRALQARKLFKLMTPQGRKETLKKMLKKQQAELAKRGKNIDLKFSDLVLYAASVAETDEDFYRVQSAAANELADQLPASWTDRIHSLRMLSMLANPRTHIRNIIGNMFFVPAVGLKNKMSALLEVPLGKGNRTKTLSPILRSDIRNFSREVAIENQKVLTGEAKFNEATEIKKAQGKLGQFMDGIADLNSRALEGEDWFFLKGHFRRAFGGWMQANGYTVEQVKNDKSLMEKGLKYAVEESQKATYRDYNEIASKLNSLVTNPKTGWGKGFGLMVDAVLPFKKTPLNILRRGLEYSPMGIAKAVYQTGRAFIKGDVTANQVIDSFCSGLSGSAIMALGFLLAGTGAVSCGLDDDEDKLDKMKGVQAYSVNFGKAGNAIADLFGVPKLFGEDVTFTMDWAAPMSMPFFVGASIRNQFDGEDFDWEKIDWDNAINAIGSISEPIFNLSMLDGVNTLFKTSQYDDTNQLTQIGAKIASNYVTSYVPSLLGAVARTLDDKQRKAFVPQGEGNGPMGTFKYAWEQVENKIPGVNKTNIAVRDIWGEEKTTDLAERIIENFISPGYIEKIKDDPILNEIGRLYDATGDLSVVPKEDPEKKVTWTKNKEKHEHVLTAEQWDKYKEVRNKTAHKELQELIESDSYKDSIDSVKIQMMKSVWNHATAVGRNALFPEYEVEEKDTAEVAKAGKLTALNAEMLKSLKVGNLNDFETSCEAIRREYEDPDDADKKIKEKIANTYRDQWKDAYRKNDKEALDRIEDLLDSTGITFNVYEGDDKGKSWQEQVDEEEDK